MSESFRTRLSKYLFNLYPAYRGSGSRISYIASDWREVHIALALNMRTRNIMGSIYGGSIYASSDPIYPLMIIYNLGDEYSVWSKGAEIKFIKPGWRKLKSVFKLTDEDLKGLKDELQIKDTINRRFTNVLVDDEGNPFAEITVNVYIAHRPNEITVPLVRKLMFSK